MPPNRSQMDFLLKFRPILAGFCTLAQAFRFAAKQTNGVNKFTENWVFSEFLEFFSPSLSFPEKSLSIFLKILEFFLKTLHKGDLDFDAIYNIWKSKKNQSHGSRSSISWTRLVWWWWLLNDKSNGIYFCSVHHLNLNHLVQFILCTFLHYA